MRRRQDAMGEEIRRRRRAQGYTQESLAFALGVDRTTVGRWERNGAEPSPRNIRMLLEMNVLDDSDTSQSNAKDEEQGAVAPDMIDGIARTIGRPLSDSEIRTIRLRDHDERVLVALFRKLPADTQRALLELLSAMWLSEHGRSRPPGADAKR